MQIAGMLLAERPLLSLRDWQRALGRVVCAMPPWPLGPVPLLDPPPTLSATQLRRLLPANVLAAWTLPMSPDQVEFAGPGDDFAVGYRGAVVTVDPAESRWWTIPAHRDHSGRTGTALRTTSGPWLDAPCVAAYGQEDPSFESPWAEESADPSVRAVDLGLHWRPLEQALPKPRVLEIASRDNWVNLTDTFPSVRPGPRAGSEPWRSWFPSNMQLVEPDWAQVAEHFDAVHLTQFAYVTAAYALLRCEHGFTTISGWGPDQTRWLTDPRTHQ